MKFAKKLYFCNENLKYYNEQTGDNPPFNT